MSTLSPNQIAEWFDTQAAKYRDMAATVRRDFGLKSGHSAVTVETPHMPLLTFPANAPSPEGIAQIIGTGKMRAKQIAAQLRIPMEMVESVIHKHPDRFETGSRGWISVKQQ